MNFLPLTLTPFVYVIKIKNYELILVCFVTSSCQHDFQIAEFGKNCSRNKRERERDSQKRRSLLFSMQ